MTVNEKCQCLHLLFNNMRPHRFSGTEINKLGFNNGVYIIRKVGCALLNKNEAYKSYLEPWYNKSYKLIKGDILQICRKLVTQHITEKTSFVAFEVKGTNKEEKGTLFCEPKIIATLAQCGECIPSKGWLGNYLPEKYGSLGLAKKIGLWLSDEADSPILSDNELLELEGIVKRSARRYG